MTPASVTDTSNDRTTEESRSRSPPPRLRRESSPYLALINGVATLCTFNRKEAVGSDSDLEQEQEGGLAAVVSAGGKRSAAAPASKSSGRGIDRGDRSLMSWNTGRPKKSSGQVWECLDHYVSFEDAYHPCWYCCKKLLYEDTAVGNKK